MAIKAATHQGNCQVCGRTQAVMGTTLAKHGYTVDFGYFSGTCRGSDRQPVQTDRSICDATIVGLDRYALECDESNRKFRAREVLPSKIYTGQKFNKITCKYEDRFIPFAEGTLDQQNKAIDTAAFQAESDARHARSHAASLQRMADALFGTQLILIVDQPKVAAPKVIVDLKTATVQGTFASKAARKEELDKINWLFDKEVKKIQGLLLAIPNEQRTEEQTHVYYSMPMYPHQWKAKHSAMALKVFPESAETVKSIEELVKAREVVKNA